ncbi:TPA: type II toxin-antitoxin system VapC family toxin [Campylobacter jejuni]|uniref:type II toxin-antitoxin system VapC family toxin n=1 Tax=Campylobacter sp. CNRCH_2016_3089 TaxID=2911609 RepID=UPI00139EE288|nr:type II toxin-antitoxin system VapC family toxin [Campylobacter sp. CNRCH_2016_3089]EAI7269729.1 type II toxin-antitoxin system VapC family toxin [Campylobacter lari]EDP6894142.1 PIN domain-containing protein [Campylobacter lari]MCV3433322.1 type II toxin-antitoxin system VapC family toxin [Campylobacter lari]MCV3509228.1 type II toxin-antitoxin system VapC family toxin [Campylobacter sp. CNRCH_2016_3089]
MKKVYLDTNIFLDYFNQERAYHNEAKQLIYYLLANNIQIVFSEDMVSTIAYLIKKENLSNFTHFLKTISLKESFNIAPFGMSVINIACDYYNNKNGDFEDYLQYFCAEKEGCCAIYTMDRKFPNLKIPIKRYGEIDI